MLKTNEWRSKTMNIETIDNQFDTRAGTLLRYYTALLERSRNEHVAFKINDDPFDVVYIMMKGRLYGHVYIKDCKVRKSFLLASPKHTEGLIRSIQGHYAGYELHDGQVVSISNMMAELLFDNDYFMYGLEAFAESHNTDVFEYIEKDFNINELEGTQSSNADVIGNLEMVYQLATGINEPSPELVEGLKLVTEFVQNEKATQADYKTLEARFNELKASYYATNS